MIRNSHIMLSTILLICVSCQAQVRTSCQLSDEDLAAIESVTEVHRRAGLSADWDSFFGCLTEDAVWMGVLGRTLTGRKTIREGAPWVRALSYDFSLTEIRGHGDIAVVRGTLSIMLGSGHPVREKKSFLKILRRQPDGTWLISRLAAF